MWGCRFVSTWLLLLVPYAAWGGEPLPQADLSLTVTIDPAHELYAPGSAATVEYTVHNLGPDDAPGAYLGAGLFAFGGPNSQVLLLDSEATPPCVYATLDFPPVPGFHGYFAPSLTYPPIAAGESVTCRLSMFVLDTARGTFELEARVNPATGANTSVDPVATNDRVSLSIPLTAGPPLMTDLSVGLELLSDAAIHPPGSEVRLRLAASNAGPDATGGSTVIFDPSLVTSLTAPFAVLTVPDGTPGCSAQLVPAAGSSAFTVSYVRFSQLAVGETRVCELRLLVLADAPEVAALSAFGTTEPDFGAPTVDPNPSDDDVVLMVRTVASVVAAAPAVVPALHLPALLLLVGVMLMVGRVAMRRG